MAAITVPAPTTAPPPDIKKWFLIILLAVAVGASAHAVIKHGLEAAKVTDGCNQRGPTSTWEALGAKNDGAFWQICETDDGEYGVRQFRCTKNGWKSETAFIPDGSQLGRGTLARAEEYVSGKARKFFGRLLCP